MTVTTFLSILRLPVLLLISGCCSREILPVGFIGTVEDSFAGVDPVSPREGPFGLNIWEEAL